MFGALNRFISRLDSDTPSQNSNGHGTFGFQVLRNKNLDLPIEPWFDFIIGINGRQIDDPDPSLFATEIRNCAGATVTLGLWSAKGQRFRETHIPVPSNGSSLGLALQWTPLSTTEDVWHILDVIPNSPADTAGLLPYGDYIIGTPEGIVRGEAGLGELVEDHLSRPLRLHVYNHEYAVTRLVTIIPSRQWGGSGALGCVLGFGALHRLPVPLNEPPSGPGETLFETARFSSEEGRPASSSSPGFTSTATGPIPPLANDFIVPATQLTNLGHPLMGTKSPAQKPSRKLRPHHVMSPNSAMNDYFKEGEQISKERDNAPSPNPSGKALPLLPPPKRGAPPNVRSPTPESSSAVASTSPSAPDE